MLLQGHPNFSNLEILVLEIYQNNGKWLFLAVYKPPNLNNIEFLKRIGAILDYYSQKYDNITIIGDFNIAKENTHLQSMIQAYNLNNLIKEPTCFQSNNPSQIDLILTNQKSMYTFSNTFETGLSNHHKFVSTISKSGSFKGTPRKGYRFYKSFNIDNFKSILNQKLNNLSSTIYDNIEETFLSLLNKHAPRKKKILRHNNGPFMTKELQKEIMKRSKLKNKYNKKRNYENWFLYKKQRNYCLSLMKKTKKAYFAKLNIKEIGDNKTFWKTVRPYFSDKDNKSSKITLFENNIVIADEKRVAELMNKYFVNITKNLNLKAPIINTTEDVQSLTKNYDNHISIRKLKEAYPEIVSVSLDEVKKEVLNLNPKNSSTTGTTPVTILKQTIDVHLEHLTNAKIIHCKRIIFLIN